MRFTLIMAFCLASPAAADTFAVPDGCETFLTVQYADCAVELLWRCDIAPAGDHWSGLFDAEGLASIVSSDQQNAWLDAVYMLDGSYEESVGSPVDPIDFDHLMQSGADSFDFQMRRTDTTGTRMLRVTGNDTLTGEETVIDGEPLLHTRFEYRILEQDGSVFYHARGQQYVSPALRLFFLGDDEVIDSGEVSSYENAPLDFIRPGEPGFAETAPLYGCVSKGDTKI